MRAAIYLGPDEGKLLFGTIGYALEIGAEGTASNAIWVFYPACGADVAFLRDDLLAFPPLTTMRAAMMRLISKQGSGGVVEPAESLLGMSDETQARLDPVPVPSPEPS